MGSSSEDRLASIEQRLSRIEESLNLAGPASAITPEIISQPIAPERFAPAAYRAPTISAEAKPGNWLGIIAIICFVLAAGFIVKLSIESGWLTHERQIGLAVLLGFSLIIAGFTLMKSDRAYASLLPGAGVIVLYLSVFAAHRYYWLISFESALVITALISGICIWLYLQIKHDIYAIAAAAGAYLSPVILGLHAEAIFSLYYFLLCSAAFATISIWVKSRILTLVSAYLAIFLSGLMGLDLRQEVLVAIVLALHFFIFSVATYYYTVYNRVALTQREAWSFLPVLLVFYTTEYFFIERIQPDLAPWISLGFAGLLIGLYLCAKKQFPGGLGSQSLIMAFATIVAFHSIYLELLPAEVRPWLFVLVLLAVTFSPLSFSSQKNGPLRFPAFAVLAIVVIEYLTMLSHLMSEYTSGPFWLLVSFAALASLWLFIASPGTQRQHTHLHALLGAAHLLAIIALYRLTHDVSSLAVSASWLFYGVGIIAFAFTRKDLVIAKSALFVLAFAAAKALLYDAASAPTIIRILCLLLTGAVLYSCGLFLRKFNDWTGQKTE